MRRARSRKNLWEAMPSGAKTAIGRCLSWLPPKFVLGGAFRRALHFVREADRWPTERSRTYALGQLRAVCALAGLKSHYYARAFDAVGFDPRDLRTVEDIRGLPTITRHTVGAHLSEMLTCDPQSSGVDAISTGGTGGEPLTFYIGARRSAVEYAYLVAGWERVGFRVGDRQAVFRGRVVGPDAEGLRHEWDPLLRHHVYSTFHMSEADIGRNMAHLASIGPCFLHVYPSSVDALARYLQRAGRTGPSNVRGILAESEIVYPQQRSLAEEMFACRYFSSYGHTEKLVAAAECEHSSNYHVWPTYGYFELLDERGHAVTTPGERGEIVGTGFINKVVPFVRYRTGDYATYVGDRCPQCGREQTLIADIRGHRVQEFLVALDGSLVPWTALNMHDDTFRSVRQFQFHQDTPGQATLRLAPVNGLPDSERDRILASLNRKLCGRVALRAELVDHIALTPRGKAIYVDQRTPGVQPSRSEG